MKVTLSKIHRAKWLYDRCKSIDEMLQCLGQEITHLEELQELGVELERMSDDDYTHFVKEAEVGSEEHKDLLEHGFNEDEDLE